jgi:hypothetical protein
MALFTVSSTETRPDRLFVCYTVVMASVSAMEKQTGLVTAGSMGLIYIVDV